MQEERIPILYEDSSVIVCEKPAGVPTQSREAMTPDMVSLLKKKMYAKTGAHDPYLAVIHRLDQPVRGLLVFAKTPSAAKALNRQLNDGTFGKFYLARVTGTLPDTQGILEDYLVKEPRTNLSRVCTKDTPKAKLARLSYREIRREGERTLVEIKLITGRHHQIRVQLAHAGCPIVGDLKYNSDGGTGEPLALCAYRLEFRHPGNGETLCFQIEDPLGISDMI